MVYEIHECYLKTKKKQQVMKLMTFCGKQNGDYAACLKNG